MTQIDVRQDQFLVDVETGEQLPVTVENAGRVLDAARRMKYRLNDVIADATGFLLEVSATQGTKTIETTHGKIVVSGGPTVEYDCLDLMAALRAAGCPEERIMAAVQEEISYKPNRSVLQQLASANGGYRAAIESAERTVERPWRAAVK